MRSMAAAMKVLTDAAAGGHGYNKSVTAEEAPHFQEDDSADD